MIIDAIKLTGLLLLTGAVFFHIHLLWSFESSILTKLFQRHAKWIAISSAALYLSSVLLTGLLSYRFSHQLDFTAEYINLLLVPLFIACTLRLVSTRNKALVTCTVVLGTSLLISHTSASNAAGQQGVLPALSDFIHLASAAVWGGGLTGFACLLVGLPKQDHKPYLADMGRLVSRFSGLAIISLILIMVSGAILAVSNIHSMDALASTQYGSGFKLKILLVFCLICLLIIHLLKTTHGLEAKTVGGTAPANRIFRRLRILVMSMAIFMLLIFIVTSGMRSYPPPDTAPFLTPQSWSFDAGVYPLRLDLQPVAGSMNNVRFEVYVPDVLMQNSAALVTYSLYIPGTGTGVWDVEAIQVSPNSYQGEATFPMPGNWRLDMRLIDADGGQVEGRYDFELPAMPLVEDLRTYLSYSAIVYSPANIITFIVGLLLLLTYGWLTWRSQAGLIPRWILVPGLVGISIGIYLLMSVVLVKTYPSTYRENPQPYTADSVDRGKVAYIEFCADCHAPAGTGDGPWAVENRGQIPSLASPHMDVHTDGEIYWWITYGIPSLDMPALGEELTEDKRWQIINYVRSLRHGYPP